MNNAPVLVEQTYQKDIVLVDNTYFENEAIEKFNFKAERINNRKQFFLYLIAVVVILTSVIGFNVYSNGIVDVPQIIVPTQTITNEPISIVSTAKPFFVKLGSEVIHSKLVDKSWTVNLGKLEGKTEVQIGGMIDFGFTKITSNTTKSYTFERDYIAPKTTTDLKSKYDTKDVKYSITFEAPEDNFVVRDNQTVIYDKNAPTNNCKIDKDNQLKLNCSMTINEANTDSHQITVTDQYGNSSIVNEGIIQLVATNDFDCNQDIIANEGKIKCKGNKDSTVTIAGIKSDYKASTEFESQTILENGIRKVEINVVDKDELTKNLAYEVMVEKDKLSIDLSSTKFYEGCGIPICEGKIVKAKSNKNVSLILNVSSTIKDNNTGKVVSNNQTVKSAMITNNINANVDTNFYKHYPNYFDGDSNRYKLNVTYDLTFTANNGKSLSYICDINFMCYER